RIEAGALARLAEHGFPGNVRELENLLHRALALSGHDSIGAQDIGLPAGDELDTTASMPLDSLPASSPAPEPAVALPSDLQMHLDVVERDILLKALDRHRYNRTAAGASLGLSLRQMRYRMARLGIDGDSGD
ncbi:MAG: sigma-54-dependent Fis family transcriptional regulator, partial [Rhodoferax sp.]|nr:sigma-54-dependent Fis family transcriptional regulator [Rhodoferax sp.]